MSNAGDKAAERRQFLGLDQAVLRLTQLHVRQFGTLLGSAQFLFCLDLRDRVLAEYFDGARHDADFIVRIDAMHPVMKIAGDDRVHRLRHILKRGDDAACNQDAE